VLLLSICTLTGSRAFFGPPPPVSAAAALPTLCRFFATAVSWNEGGKLQFIVPTKIKKPLDKSNSF
jgi:hypothetical protein